jgi:hypothetical protein
MIQVIILNQVQFNGYVNPYIYVLFILLLPLKIARYAELLLAFFLGLSVDIFSNTLGIHSFATVLMAYLRPTVVNVISAGEEIKADYPGLKQNRFLWFVYYVSILVFIHHFVLFFIEVFSFTNFFVTLLRVFVSWFFSVFVMVLSQFLIFRE